MAFLRDPWLPPLLPVTLPQYPQMGEAELEEKEAGLVELEEREEAGLVEVEVELELEEVVVEVGEQRKGGTLDSIHFLLLKIVGGPR